MKKQEAVQLVSIDFPLVNGHPSQSKKPYRIRNKYNYEFLLETDPESNDEASVTVPGEALTVREIFERHTQGLPTTSVRSAMWDDDPDFDDVDMNEVQNLDLVDKEELVRQTLELKQRIEDSLKAKQKQDEEKGEEERTKDDDSDDKPNDDSE